MQNDVFSRSRTPDESIFMKSPFCSSKEIADIDLREIEPSATESDIEVSSSVR